MAKMQARSLPELVRMTFRWAPDTPERARLIGAMRRFPGLVAIPAARSGRESLEHLVDRSPLVLVVAPDKDFRRSLEFALEAEGFTVDSYGSMAGAFASSRAEEAGCAVVDDTAIGKWPEVEKESRHFGRPVVLLSDRIGTMPRLPLTTVLSKPFLGNPLIEAVRQIVTTGA